MTVPEVLGLDLSLAASGIATAAREWALPTDPAAPLEDRLDVLVDGIMPLALNADLIVLEDLPKNARFGGVDLGAVHGTIRRELKRARLRHRVALVPPSNLKKYATGRGGASKPDVRMDVYKRLGLDIADNNACDARVLYAMGMDHLGHPLATMPAIHRAALTGCRWP